jgi:molybdenum-dependent DNA-binding transcriptional regulator ModE
MTHEEFSRKGGAAKSLAKLTAAARNLCKAQEARKEKQRVAAAKKKAAGIS